MMEVALGTILASLEANAPQLNEVSDQANQALANLEERLTDLNIGIEFWHSKPIQQSDAEGTTAPNGISRTQTQQLGLARIDAEWRLAVKPIVRETGFYEGDESCPYENEFAAGPVTPLLNASRDLRIAAIQAMPGFLGELNKHIVTKIQEIQDVTDKLK